MTGSGLDETDTMPEQEQTQGAVIVIDALGFASIWRRHSAKKVAKSLVIARAFSDGALRGLEAVVTDTSIEASFFSDTVIFSALPRAKPVAPDLLMIAAAAAAIGFMRAAAFGDPALVYRGCAAFGDVERAGDFLVGAAIDAASNGYQRANAAAVWLMPSAAALVEHLPLRHVTFFYRTEVPIKNVGRIPATLLNPFGLTAFLPEHGSEAVGIQHNADHRAAILKTFDSSDDPEVMLKRHETARLLDVAEQEIQEAAKVAAVMNAAVGAAAAASGRVEKEDHG
jgi:hypothetical protein